MLLLKGFPGIDAEIADILFNAAPTFENLLAMSVEDFTELKRFGKKRSEGLYRFLHEGKLID